MSDPDSAAPEDTRSLLEQAFGRRFTEGNSIDVLRNGVEIFPAMLAAVDSATVRIDFATYVYWQGDIARRFARALARQAKEGVRVRVLLDAFGAKSMDSSLVEDMEAAGVEVRWFRPLSSWRVWQVDKRTHRKLLICDDVVGFTGGVGIAREWEGDARNPQEWRDTHIALRGPAITGLRAAFLDNWNEAGDWTFERKVAQPAMHSDGIPVQVLRASTTIAWTDMATMFRALITLARRRIRIVTAYFCPEETLVDLLIAASARGVDVQILVSGQYCDSRISQLAGHVHIEPLLEAKVRIWRYERTMLHTKAITIDSGIACLGSANFNHRSVCKDEECSVIALSPQMAQTLERHFDEDCAHAQPYELDTWVNRGLLLRLQERLAGLLADQL
jgi:cardiolipin synthase